MKKVILFSLLMVFSYTQLISKDKVTLVAQIESSDTIPVFIKLGEIKPATFDNNMTSFRLNSDEAAINSMERINAKVPNEYSDLLNLVCEALNKNFNTMKFVPFPTEQLHYVKNKQGVDEIDLVKMNRKNVVMLYFDADYGYVNMSGFSRTNDKKRTLLSSMQLTGLLMVHFFHMHEVTSRPDKISSTGTFIYSGHFSVEGIYNSAEDLFIFCDPKLLIERSKEPINSRIEKLAEKENKAYQKSLK